MNRNKVGNHSRCWWFDVGPNIECQAKRKHYKKYKIHNICGALKSEQFEEQRTKNYKEFTLEFFVWFGFFHFFSCRGKRPSQKMNGIKENDESIQENLSFIKWTLYKVYTLVLSFSLLVHHMSYVVSEKYYII